VATSLVWSTRRNTSDCRMSRRFPETVPRAGGPSEAREKSKAITANRLPSRRRNERTTHSARNGASHALNAARLLIVLTTCLCVIAAWSFHKHYSLAFQSPVVVRFQSPFVISKRTAREETAQVKSDHDGSTFSGWQQYVCRKFGGDCSLALAIQRAENASGKCEVYHYNSDGSLDWGYFQINTVHVQRSDVNLRDLLDCKANIDFAHKLYLEHGGFSPWSTFRNGKYRRFLVRP
jgi:hypothetical protein